ncbi:MAG: undecaprenyldiphospho-muramoylpentapeptide beta-N-acetylglucosaminyltransferase [Acidobacteriota bacterium]
MSATTPNHPAQSSPQASGEPHALLSGGGSGGHVFPGLAIAEELARRGWQVSWAGSRRGIESRLVSQRQIPFHDLPARPVVGQGVGGKLRAVATMARSAWSARALVRRLRARVVVGTGGYASVPAVVGARLARRPAYLLEPNADVGLANRWLSRCATEAAVAFDATRQQLACPSRTTGIPIRSEFAQPAAWSAAPPWNLLVLGGSQGARQINQLVPQALAALPAELGEVHVLHQTGKDHLEATRDDYLAAGHQPAEDATPANGGVRFTASAFIDDMAGAMGRSHLVVSRAGAITLAEICAAARPSLLLPLVLAGAHQAGNAERLATEGAARVVPADAAADDLGQLLADLLSDAAGLHAMAEAAGRLGRGDAAARIADRLEAIGGVAQPQGRAA